MTASMQCTVTPPTQAPSPRRREDIQALRAVAVMLVVAFHLWPRRVTAGYVGVDIFLVISGFLITSHLLSSPPRSMRDVAAFWGRRIRRLLPAAFTVILATAVAGWALLPESQWRSLARDAVASAAYVENWNLASTTTDYLGADAAASPFQQFWSLSVEEQFYLVWPLLMAAAAAVAAHRILSLTQAVAAVVGLVFVLSLTASVLVTESNPQAAYFVTYTRMWELALGGVLAVATTARPTWFTWSSHGRAVVAWIALIAMVWSAFSYTAATAFPGIAALVPTLAAAAFLAASSQSGSWSPHRVMRVAPIQHVGDVSYSIYLWHWPIIVMLPYVLGGWLTWPVKLGIVAVTVLVASLSKKWIEDPPQRSLRLRKPRWSVAIAVGGILGIVAFGAAQVAVADAREQRAEKDLAAVVERNQACLGAAAMAPGADCGGPHGEKLLTTAAQAADDRPDAYADDCWVSPPFGSRKTCTYGQKDNPSARIALVGNSHAGHWLPALQVLAEKHKWQITTFLVSECFPVDLPQDFSKAGATAGCREWTKWALKQTVGQSFDLVVTSNRSGPALSGVAEGDQVASAARGYLKTLGTWADAGDPVLVLRDTPYGEVVTPDCIDAHLSDLGACDGPQSRREVPDPMADAARAMGREDIRVADTTPAFCANGQCYSTIGGLIVYFDRSHMTTAFAKTLAPVIEPAVTALMPTER